jgi:hypothetical protein
MSLEKIIKEALDQNPLEMKDAFAEEMQSRIAAALEEKYKSAMEEDLEEAKDDDDEDEDDDDDDDDDEDDDEDDDSDSDDAKIGAEMKKLHASNCSKTEMYAKMKEKYDCSKGKLEGLYASYCTNESMSEDELVDMIESMSENELLDMVESVSDETLEEGPFAGVGKILMKHKLKKAAKAMGKQRSAKSQANTDLYKQMGNRAGQTRDYIQNDKAGSALYHDQTRAKRALKRLNRTKTKDKNAIAATKAAKAKAKSAFPFNARNTAYNKLSY